MTWGHAQNPFTTYRFGILLSMFLIQLLTAPFFEGSIAAGYAADTAFYLLLAAAAFSVRHSKFFKLALFLGVGAIAGECAGYITRRIVFMIITDFIFCFYLALVTLLIVIRVTRQCSISADTVMGGLCVYVLIGIFWTVVFVNLDLLRPGSFDFEIHGAHPTADVKYALLMYYSFVPLLTIGYGDVVAISSMAQTLTIMEGLIGQFYLIFFMTTLVGLYVQKRQDRDTLHF